MYHSLLCMQLYIPYLMIHMYNTILIFFMCSPASNNAELGGRRRPDIFNLDEGDIFSHLSANQQCLKIRDLLYGKDGTYQQQPGFLILVG